jgi:voltage-gated potassium channel Kch
MSPRRGLNARSWEGGQHYREKPCGDGFALTPPFHVDGGVRRRHRMTSMTPEKWSIRQIARLRPVGFMQLTLCLVGILLATPLRREGRILLVVLELIFLNALLVSLSASDIRQHLRRAFFGVWAAGLAASLGATLAGSADPIMWWSIGAQGLNFILLSGCLVMVLAYIFRSPRVTRDVVFAALSAYFLIAFSFAALYSLALHVDPQNFRLPEWVEFGSFAAVRMEMVYFSLVTLATLGYGDILPSAPFTQMLAVLEAVIGQFFIAVLLAWLVGMFISDNFAGGR